MNSLPDILQALARQQPDRTALRSPEGEIRYDELLKAVNQVAGQLQTLAVTRVGLCGDNAPGWIIADLACRVAGIVCVPIPGFFSTSQTQHLINQAGLDGLLFGAPTDLRGLAVEDVVDVWGPICFKRLARVASALALPEGTSKVTFTSGSTGTPKGVCLDDHHQDATAIALAEVVGDLEIASHLCVLPLATLLENIAGVYLPLMLGATIHVWPLADLGFSGSSRLDAQRFADVINRCKPDSMILVPELATVAVRLAESGAFAGHRFRFLAVGGGRVSPDMLARAKERGLPLYEGYGLSEAGSVVALNVPDANRPGCAGRPLSHIAVTVDSNGEIRVCGNTFLGYMGEGIAAHDPGDCYLTGDLGYLDGDGFLVVNGRSKNLLITSYGRNINPEWLESELIQQVGVRQALVYGDGCAQPSALVTVDPDQDTSTLARDITALNRTLPDYARLQSVRLLREPFRPGGGFVTPNGRLMRHVLMPALAEFLRLAEPLPIADAHEPEARRA
ncbi:AMP-dependent synthetase/ligase [Marinobacter nanhaiticus D15-8W]|uniref:AMP-binding protein n=1 Tax=Marinobacter nanhaiticus TaxID=1305740 RepID=UPI0002CC47FD|nr:AMP-binding protein [Marinobacter nanhaiticus]BES69320.1 AMP-dependent synthetase/ligase [Marinobacter nanhaiticus D15-8W]